VQSLTREQGHPFEFTVSPDGRSVAARVAAANDDLWVYDLVSGTPLRLTFEAGDETHPRWTRDGTRVAYGTRTGTMFWKPADGTGAREKLVDGEFPRNPASFSPDGKTLAFVELHPSTKGDIWLLPLDGTGRAQPFQVTPADESAASFSPDGRWVAYASDESGRAEVYVRPASGSGGRRRVSNDGGRSPVWSRSGRELVWLRDDKLVAADVAPDGAAGAERVLFDAPRSGDLRFSRDLALFDVMPGGDRFVMLLRSHLPPPAHYSIIVNWFAEVQRRFGARR
jgi:serine/threonine-protein kinase